MNRRHTVAALALLAATATGLPARAAGGGVDAGDDGGLVYVTYSAGGADLTGACTYVRYAAGVGGSGITYQVVGAGSTGGVYQGIPVVATGVRCRFLLGSTMYVSGPEYLPGAVAETDRAVTSTNAAGGTVCVTVYAVLRQTPPGEADNLLESSEQC
ncbi:MAG TPA: hypothetical protein VFQ85_03970 [Mycobacteriales bacterium]|jgi:hypothetical protein|nr:hypothetical protein [Mycobacteriales bacterium]